MIKKKKKEVTIGGLSVMIKEGFAKSDKRIDEKFAQSDKRTDDKIEALAGMVQRGFSDLGAEVSAVKYGQKNLEKRMDMLERGQEDIKLGLDNVAYHFEMKRLEERVTALERKMTKA